VIGHLHDFYVPAEQRMHLAHLEARLLKERKENLVTRCHWQRCSKLGINIRSLEVKKIMSVYALQCGPMDQCYNVPTRKCISKKPDMINRISIKSGEFKSVTIRKEKDFQIIIN